MTLNEGGSIWVETGCECVRHRPCWTTNELIRIQLDARTVD